MHTLDATLKELIKEAVREVILEEAEKGIFNRLNKNQIERKVGSDSEDHKMRSPLSIIRPKELAEYLSISIATLYRMESEGRLPTKIKFSRNYVGWRYSDVEDWIVEHENRADK